MRPDARNIARMTSIPQMLRHIGWRMRPRALRVNLDVNLSHDFALSNDAQGSPGPLRLAEFVQCFESQERRPLHWDDHFQILWTRSRRTAAPSHATRSAIQVLRRSEKSS